MYNIALRITSDPDAASDCAQEAFIRAHKALHQYDPTLPFGPWIFCHCSRYGFMWPHDGHPEKAKCM